MTARNIMTACNIMTKCDIMTTCNIIATRDVMAMATDNGNKIFIGNIPFKCSKCDLVKCFSDVSGFIDADIIEDTDANRGFGFMTFDSRESASKFITAKQTYKLKERVLKFSKYADSNRKILCSKYIGKNFICVKNIPASMTPKYIRSFFETYGDIGICYVNTDTYTGASKESAIVEIVDDVVFAKLINMKAVSIDGVNYSISKWKQYVKIKKPSQIYRKNNM